MAYVMLAPRKKILFFAEGATLAHVGRPFVLARQLDAALFDVTFARPPAFDWLTAGAGFRVVDLECQDGRTFASRLDRGLPLYDVQTLDRYVQTDLSIIDEVRPDIVVGDFRLSLSVSARLRGVPYLTICDAYWSPERPLERALPVMGFTPYIPLKIALAIFRAVAPTAFFLHARPMERLRKRYGLPPLGHDLRLCYTDADLRLFANFPELFPEVPRTARADFIGPIAWSPPERADLRLPEGDGPLVYVTMGSSGDPRVLAALIPVLEAAGARVMLASAGKRLPPLIGSAQTHVCDFLPGNQMCRLAQLVVCNGGSPTTNQALVHGVPVLGIAGNMDQFLNMRAIERFGAGLLVRADRAGARMLERSIRDLLRQPVFFERAHILAESTLRTDSFGRECSRLIYALL